MIDTIKIYSMISQNVYNKIYQNGVVKSSINKKSGEIIYELTSHALIGSYSSSLNVRIGDGGVYGFKDKKYISIEGSYHKFLRGYNSHNGYYNLQSIVKRLIIAIEYDCNVILPKLQHWFLQRIDIACCFDLGSNENVCKYINNLSQCNYPRRNIKHYQDESVYCSGTSTTLKIYNKMLEFRKHDIKKFFDTSFDLVNYLNSINGFVRFECSIKKKKLEKIYNKKYIRVNSIVYKDLKNVWSDEFMKLLKLFENDLKLLTKKEDIKSRLFSTYNLRQAGILYSFYTSIVLDGLSEVRKTLPRPTYYRYLKMLKECNIDISQKYTVVAENDTIEFNPFTSQEVA